MRGQLFLLAFVFPTFAYCLLSTDLEYVSEIEMNMAATLRDYVQMEKHRMDYLSEIASSLEERSKNHSKSIRNDAISIYKSVNNLVDEWQWIRREIDLSSRDTLETVDNPGRRLPKRDDLEEVVGALFRLQDTYMVSTNDIASGAVRGLHHSGNLSAYDCYVIGINAFRQDDHYHALLWLQEAREQLTAENPPTVNDTDVLPPFIWSLQEKGNGVRARNLSKALFEYFRNDDSYRAYVMEEYPLLKHILQQKQDDKILILEKDMPPLMNDRLDYFQVTEQPTYEALCRGDYRNATFTNPKLYCYYKRTSPYLKLAPAKVEILNIKPEILFFRQIISDEEIDVVKNIVLKQLERSKVVLVGEEDDTFGVHEARTSSTAWIYDSYEEGDLMGRLRKRAGIFTGLNSTAAEFLQVTRYGIGGHYGPHYDHATNDLREKHGYHGSYDESTGDRIATLMYYLSEPENGGGTAFPYPKVIVSPNKNDAVFWYNLKKSGEGDDDALHAGCPVLSGEKWVANQWFKERGQEFMRPCSLNEHE